ncbi:MAG: cell division protein ZapA [Nitrosomonas sp.]|nr:cell division protein ZapA [Nitrosomonas sp.]
MSNENEKAINITIMGREFYVSCPLDERAELQQAAEHLDQKIKEIKQEGKVVGSEKILIIAALSISHELQIMQNGNGFDMSEFKRRITDIRSKIDEVLTKKIS